MGMSALEVLVFELSRVNRVASRTVLSADIAPLNDEIGHDSVYTVA
jgi:hypothetical protein